MFKILQLLEKLKITVNSLVHFTNFGALMNTHLCLMVLTVEKSLMKKNQSTSDKKCEYCIQKQYFHLQIWKLQWQKLPLDLDHEIQNV